MRKKLLAVLLAMCMVVSLLPAAALAADHWAAGSIERWTEEGVLDGSSLDPEARMTRAEFAQMLCSLMGYTQTSDTVFSDLPADDPAAEAISKLVKAGVMNGVGGGKVDPNGTLTREQAAVMLCRALDIRPSSSAMSSFKDSANVSSWAAGAMAALTERGMLHGVGGGLLAPGGLVSNGTAAALVDKMVGEYVTEDRTITGEVKGIVLVVKGAKAEIKDATLSDPVVVKDAAATLTNTKADDVVANGGTVTTDAKTTVVNVTLTGEAPKATISGSVAGDVTAAGSKAVLAVKGDVAGSVELKGETPKATIEGKVEGNVTAAGTKPQVEVKGDVAGTVSVGGSDAKVDLKGEVAGGVTVAADATGKPAVTAPKGTEVKNDSNTSASVNGGTVASGDNTTTTTNPSTPGGSTGGSSSGGDSTGGGNTGTTTPPATDPDPETPTTYTVTFETKGGSAVTAQTVTSGASATKPNDPTKSGFTFGGWFTDSDCATAYNFTAKVTANITLYAKWTGETTTGGSASGGSNQTDNRADTAITAAINTANDAETEDANNNNHKHTWAKNNGENAVTGTLSCTVGATVHCTCSGESCNATKDIAVPALGHDTTYAANETARYGADNTQHWFLCKYCGEASETKTNHAFTTVQSSTGATCVADGSEVKACACGMTQTIKISALGHKAATEWSKDQTNHWHTCTNSNCTVKLDTAAHDWSDKNGTCKVCSQKCSKEGEHENIVEGKECEECGFAGTKKEMYSITISVDENAGGTVAADKTTGANKDDTVVLTVTPAEGYQLKADSLKVMNGQTQVTVTAVSGKTNEYTFKMPAAAVTVTAVFEKISYNISLAEGTTDVTFTVGEVDGATENATQATKGDKVTVKFEPQTGKTAKVSAVDAKNQSVEVTEKDGTYTFNMPAANVTVTVTFEETTPGGGGGGEPGDDETT